MDARQPIAPVEKQAQALCGLGFAPCPDEKLRLGNRGLMNPEFLEWLMGWPEGWTGLEPLETGKFLAWQRSHGAFFRS